MWRLLASYGYLITITIQFLYHVNQFQALDSCARFVAARLDSAEQKVLPGERLGGILQPGGAVQVWGAATLPLAGLVLSSQLEKTQGKRGPGAVLLRDPSVMWVVRTGSKQDTGSLGQGLQPYPTDDGKTEAQAS
jgi:hypothetical protein